MSKIRIGPAGNSESFYNGGHTSTIEAPKWLSERGLDAFEYSFGKGVRMSQELAKKIGGAMREFDIGLSVHAPYYVSLASQDPEKVVKSYGYIMSSLKALDQMGGSRCVVHVAYSGTDREESLRVTEKGLMETVRLMYEQKLEHLYLCPETMGKHSQIGSPDEIIRLCKLDSVLLPCYDFGHINSLTQGSLRSKDDYKRLIDECIDGLGEFKALNMHIHFSKIQYGSKGEVRHLTFKDDVYGPPFEPLAEVIAGYKMTPVLICESDGVMAEDACTMRDILVNAGYQS